MRKNFILNTDSYKASHYLQYPPGTEYVSCYIESRGGKFDSTLFFGLQAFLKEYLVHPISEFDIEEADSFFKAHGLPFNRAGWEYILEKYQGYLPLEVESVLEGSIIPCSNVLVQVINTDPKCFWLSSYVETALLRAIWYPTTVATISWHCKQVIAKYMMETSGHLNGLEFKLHDFGARGASTFEAAKIGGMAHLLNFCGSDTISGVLGAREYYGEDMAAFSIPAAEHSTIIAWGEEGEADAYENIVNKFSGPQKIVAAVSDSYDLWEALEKIWGEKLYEKVKNNGGIIVIRPDSGEPVRVVTKTIGLLMEKFGFTLNSKGYKVLPPFLRVIQGDGISLESIESILSEMKKLKQSAENITFGMGAALLQKCNRDTLGFAMKASAVCINGKWKDIAKQSIIDPSKQSKSGRLALIKNAAGQWETINAKTLNGQENLLRKIYSNGKILTLQSFKEIKERV